MTYDLSSGQKVPTNTGIYISRVNDLYCQISISLNLNTKTVHKLFIGILTCIIGGGGNKIF